VAQLAAVPLGGRRILYAPHSCFACGVLNAHGLHMSLHAQDDRCWSAITLDARFQGWDEVAHGGILATILDEVMAWTLVSHDTWSVTAKLDVSFHRPVMIGRPIRAEGWVVEARRRVSRTAASIMDPVSGELLASAEGTYVAAPPERRAELKARYRFRLAPGNDPGQAATGDAGSADTTDPGAAP
jgi:uncharacterized protein (TIGR00369 family)